jgi:hypothetical protein
VDRQLWPYGWFYLQKWEMHDFPLLLVYIDATSPVGKDRKRIIQPPKCATTRGLHSAHCMREHMLTSVLDYSLVTNLA